MAEPRGAKVNQETTTERGMLDILGERTPHITDQIFEYVRGDPKTLLKLRHVNKTYRNWVDDDTTLWTQFDNKKRIRAIQDGRADIVKLMTKDLEDPNPILDDRGQTCLHYAADYGQYDIAKMILESSTEDKNPTDQNGITPLHICALWPVFIMIRNGCPLKEGPAAYLSTEGNNEQPHHGVTRICKQIIILLSDEDKNPAEFSSESRICKKAPYKLLR